MLSEIKKPIRKVRAHAKRIVPRPLGSIENYKAEFDATAHAYAKFLKRGRLPLRIENGIPVGVVVTPWVGTPAPWLSITLAWGLAERGRNVILIWDDIPFPVNDPFIAQQNKAIERILESINGHFDFVRMSEEQPVSSRVEDEKSIEKLVNQNLIWSSRGKSLETVPTRQREQATASLTRSLGLIRGLLARQRFDYLVATSGVILSSGLYLWAGKEAGVRVATYDSGIDAIFISADGIAAQQQDIPRAFAMTMNSDSRVWERILTYAHREFELRRNGRDRQRFQLTGGVKRTNRESAAKVVIPLSLEWDAAQLGNHLIFENTVDWVCSTVEFVLGNSNCDIIVRQHPAERKKYSNSNLDLHTRLRQRFGVEPRLEFISATDPVNTYDLISSAEVVIPFVSTIGVEAAAMAKTVLVSGESYYADLGFVWKPKSRNEYFTLLERAIAGELPRLPQQIEKAWLCYYLTQLCNFLWTKFTAQPPNFWQWITIRPDRLFDDSIVEDILTSIDQNVPVAVLQHHRQPWMNRS